MRDSISSIEDLQEIKRHKSEIAQASRELRQSYMAKRREDPRKTESIPHVPDGSLPKAKDAEEQNEIMKFLEGTHKEQLQFMAQRGFMT